MSADRSIFSEPPVPNPATSTREQRRRWIVDESRAYARDLALEELLCPPAPEPPLPSLPDPDEPMPARLAELWDRFSPLEHACLRGGRIWTEDVDRQWPRIAICVDIFRAHGLDLADAIGLCRLRDGLGAVMPAHAEIVRAIWQAGEPGYEGPPNWRRIEHLSAIEGLGLKCNASAQEIASIAAAEWADAKAYAADCLEAIRRRVWPMCRAQMPPEVIRRAADAVALQRDAFVPDELLNALLQRIWMAAQPRTSRKGGHHVRPAA